MEKEQQRKQRENSIITMFQVAVQQPCRRTIFDCLNGKRKLFSKTEEPPSFIIKMPFGL